ncbi:MAG: histidine kinase [Ignavibacteriaceae bacterium]|nr:histidine kinase [Ignavibacteriaceae bacterium]
MQDNPILKNFRNLSVLLLYSFSYAAASFLILYFGLKLGLNASVIESTVSALVLCGLTIIWHYPAKYISIEQNSLLKVLGSHIITAIVSSGLWILLIYIFMVPVLGFEEKYQNFFYGTLLWRFLAGLMLYAVVVSFYYLVSYYSESQERAVKESELKNLITQAELKSLKFQINPHFIFNSLNSMSALTEIDPKKAKEMIIKLADFLRYILATNEREKNKLSEELKNIRLYLDIEKIRFEDKFDYSEEIDEDCDKAEIPNMILQPLFENVVKHAVYETLDKVNLTLKCKLDKDYLRIHLQNNFDESSKSRKGAGVGLKNIYDRLNLIYHRDDLMEVKKEKGIFSVTLFIPCEEQLENKLLSANEKK